MPELISPSPDDTPDVTALLGDLRRLINEARERAAVAVNRELTLMHWHIGDHIRRDILQEARAAYGERIVATLSQQLEHEFGRGFSRYNLVRMMQFAELFSDEQIVSTLSRQLGWSHFIELLPIGLILCSERSPQQIELLELDKGDIRVAEYFTKNLPSPLLEQELQRAVRRAREHLKEHQASKTEILQEGSLEN